MNSKSEEIALFVLNISRTVFILAILFVLGAAISDQIILGVLGLFLASVSWITPGILLIIKVPWLAQSWLRGINTNWVPGGPWDGLPNFKRFLVYFYATLLSVFMIAALIEVANQYFR